MSLPTLLSYTKTAVSRDKNRNAQCDTVPLFLIGLKGQQLMGYNPVKGYKSILVSTALNETL